MVKGYYNEVNIKKIHNYINVNKKVMKTYEVKYSYCNLVNVFIYFIIK